MAGPKTFFAVLVIVCHVHASYSASLAENVVEAGRNDENDLPRNGGCKRGFPEQDAGWREIGTGCVGSRGNHFALLTYKETSGFVSAFRLTHVRGRIGCSAGARTNWGCNSRHRTNMYVTDINNVVMYPSPVLTKPYQKGGWYHLPGYDENSPKLVFSDVGTRFIYSGQQIRVWYGEDLYGYTEADNHGLTCFKAELYFLP
ncbi:uncharacterized protein LOC114533995 [Dendronephthya gigantea]|uniref:uncharacterized protein LOC114533995 n=1 Tax=Dendronephthya gigantea TaxID=151771 RepID=UPI00106D4B64|nr:uncharacterized protein LOC114533995 [Dendronephthya gigantea]